MPPKRLSVSLNPLWYYYVAVATLGLAVLLGLFRYYIVGEHTSFYVVVVVYN